MKNIIAANWKMHFNIEEAAAAAEEMASLIDINELDVVVCPNFVHLDRLNSIFSDTVIRLGAQNMYFEEKGAFTGEVSPVMLKSVGCDYVILGHSERRHIFKEDNVLINEKVKSALKHNLIPIVCVGETLEEKNGSRAFDVIKEQVEMSLKDINLSNIIIAYEPVWAIGTGVAADEETIKNMHDFIRSLVKDTPILYGGSVKPANADNLAAIENVNGFLVGGASLKPDDFKDVIDKFLLVKGEK